MKRTRFIQFLTSLAAVATMGFTTQVSADDYTWNGGKVSSSNRYYWETASQWNNAQGSQTTWSNGTGNNAFFTSSGQHKNAVWIHTALTAGTVHVQDAGYTFTLYASSSGGTLNISMNELSLEASALTATTNRNTKRTLTLGTLSNTVSSTLTLNDYATVAATNTKVAEGTTLTVAGSGTQAGSLGALTLGENSTLAISNTGANFTLGSTGTHSTLADGAKLSFTGGKTYTLTGTFDVTINESQGGSDTGVNGFATALYSAKVVEGNVTNNATWTVNGHNATYSNGTVSYEGGISYETYHIYNGTVSVTGIYDEAGEHSGEVKTAALHDGTLDLNGTITTVNAEGGSIVMNGGSNTNGTVKLAADTTLSISGDSGSLTFTGGTLGKDAKLHFDGSATYTLSGLYDVQGGTGGGGGGIVPTKNGFANGDFTATVVEGTGTVDVNGATWKLNGADATYNNGTISASGTAYDTYYIVQTGSTVTVTDINQAAGTHASELKTIALNKGTLSLNGNLANQTIIAQNGTTVDAGTKQCTRSINEFELASGASVVLEGGGSGSTSSDVATINVGTLSVASGNSTLVVNGKTNDDEYMNVLLQVRETIVGDNAKLTVKGQSGKQDNTLGAITLGKDAVLELAGHRTSSHQSNRRRFEMTVDGGTMGDGSLILLSLDATAGNATNADYTLNGTFNVTSSNAGTPVLPTGNGFATANISAEVLRNETAEAGSGVTVYNTATWYLNGKKATYSNGTISVTGAPVYGTWYQKSGTVSITEIMTAAGEGASLVSTVELSGGTLTVDGDIATVNATGGTVNVASKEYKIGSLNVNEDTTVAGEVDSSVVGIASGKTATFADGLKAQGVEYASADTDGVQVTNNGKQTQTYDISKQDMSVKAYTLSKVATEDVTDMNKFQVSSIVNQMGGTLWLAGMTQQETLEVNELSIGTDSTVKITDGTAQQAQELTIHVKDTLTGGTGSTLLANLVLEDGSYLNLGGGQMYLGSQLTLGTNIGMDQATLDAIAALENIGDTWVLFQAVDGTKLSYSGVSNEDWARTHFDLSSITDADYKIVATDKVFGIEKVSNVPEPATGTLSLLALAALAARRRRK